MESGDDEETCRKLWNSPGIVIEPRTVFDEVIPLVHLAAQKDNSADNGEAQILHGGFCIARTRRSYSHSHDGTAADEIERHERNQHHVEYFGLRGPAGTDGPH